MNSTAQPTPIFKDGTKPPSKRALTPAEREVHEAFAPAGVPIVVVTSVEEAMAVQ